MTKIIKMSLVAAVAVAGLSTTSSANTLKEAFAASTIKGEIKSQYFKQEKASGVESSIFTNGGNLSLKTGSFNGLTAGVTFQTGHVASKDDDSTYYDSTMNASGSVMSESYLAYTINNTTGKIGRQYISTPLVAGSGSRMFKQAFEGLTVVNTDIADTTIVAAYVNKYQHRTSTAEDSTDLGGAPTFGTGTVDQGAITLYVKNTSITNLTLQAQYASRNNATTADTNIMYGEANLKLSPVTVSAQTIQSDDGSTTSSDGALYGIKAAGKVGMVSLMAAYTTSDDEADVVPGLGSGADKSYTAGAIFGGNYTADTDAYKIGLGTKVMDLGLNLSYANFDESNVDWSETNVTGTYAFNKEASVKVMHSMYGGSSTQDTRSRIYLSYKF